MIHLLKVSIKIQIARGKENRRKGNTLWVGLFKFGPLDICPILSNSFVEKCLILDMYKNPLFQSNQLEIWEYSSSFRPIHISNKRLSQIICWRLQIRLTVAFWEEQNAPQLFQALTVLAKLLNYMLSREFYAHLSKQKKTQLFALQWELISSILSFFCWSGTLQSLFIQEQKIWSFLCEASCIWFNIKYPTNILWGLGFCIYSQRNRWDKRVFNNLLKKVRRERCCETIIR